MRVHRVHFQDGHPHPGVISALEEDGFCRRQSTPVGPYPPLTLPSTPSSLTSSSTYRDVATNRMHQLTNSSFRGNGWPLGNSKISGIPTDNSDRGLNRFRTNSSHAASHSSGTRFRAGSIGMETVDRPDSPASANPILRIRSTDSFTNSDQLQSKWYGSLKARSSRPLKTGVCDQIRRPDRLDEWKSANGYTDSVRRDLYSVTKDNSNVPLDVKPNTVDDEEAAFSNSLEELQKSLFDQLEKLRSLNAASGLHYRKQMNAEDDESTDPRLEVSTKQAGTQEEPLKEHKDVEDGNQSLYEGVTSPEDQKTLIDEQCKVCFMRLNLLLLSDSLLLFLVIYIMLLIGVSSYSTLLYH